MTTAGEAALVAGTTTVTVTGTQVISAGIATAGILYFSKRSDKEKSTDKPSWVNTGMVDSQKTAQQNATDILNNKYGAGKWKKGSNSEFSKIVKWIIRDVFFYGK